MRVSMMVMQNPSEVAAAQAARTRGAAEDVRNAAEQARDIARAQREAARDQRDAAQAQRETQREAQGGTTGSENLVVTVTRDGRTVTLNGTQDEVFSTLGIAHGNREEPDGPYVVGTIAILSTAMVLIVGLVLRHRGKRNLAQKPVRDAEMTERLSRMESAIETVAVEVERISEGQRFTTRLLSERATVEVPRG